MLLKKEYINLKINNLDYFCEKNLVLIDALACNNIEVPRFCFNENLSIAGNCRMCLIELKNSIKPIASCAINVIPNMEVFTNTKLVKQAREYILEFLLINHPLDCPICDQGGECDLQDEVYTFGTDRGRFYEYKRAVLNMFCSPIIKLILTRCIHCTRCVRFFEEIGGIPFFGMINRGHNMQISSYTKKNLINFELSGNVIDLCPVGALTFKPSAFIGRAWEYDQGYTIDFFDTFLSNIRIDYKNNYKIIRILPNINFENDWIHDKTRLFFDIFNFEKRYKDPYHLRKNYYVKTTWHYILKYTIVAFLETKIKLLFLGDFLDLNTLLNIKIFKHFSNSYLKTELDYRVVSKKTKKNLNFFCFFKKISKNDKYIFNNILKFINFNILHNLMLINCNIRYEIPLLNAKLRSYSLLNKYFNIYVFGSIKNINFKYISLENNIKDFYNFLEGKKWYCNKFINFYYLTKNISFKINQNLFGISNFILSINYSFEYFNDFIYKKLNYWNYNVYTLINTLQPNITLLNSFFLNLFNSPINFSFKSYKKKRKLIYYINTNVFDKLIRRKIKKLFFNKKQKNKFYYFGWKQNILTYEFNKKEWPCTVSQKLTFNVQIYQGIFPEIFFKDWYKKKYNIIMPVKNLFEYNSFTFKFDGQIKNFFKIFERTLFKTHNEIFINLLNIYIPYKFNIVRLWRRYEEKNKTKLNILEKVNSNYGKNYNINIFYLSLFNKNFSTENKIYYICFKSIIKFNYIKTNIIYYKNYFLINYFNKYYNNRDVISNLSELILISSKFLKKHTNFK